MTMPLSRPADGTAVDPLTRELAAQGHRVVFASDGGEPSLTAVGGQLRGYARTGRTAEAAAVELRFAGSDERRPFLAEGLGVTAGSSVRIVPVYASGEREWFSVIEADPGEPIGPWRVRLFERSGGRGKLLTSHESHAHLAGTQIRRVYEQNGEVAIIRLRGSIYAVAGGRVLVLEGPGEDAGRFAETSDPNCPPNKRCYPLPAEIDAKSVLGAAPGGRSFVMADEGKILRRDTSTGATLASRYENFFYTGIVEDDAVVLAHAGEPPFVKRWSAAAPQGQLLVAGPIYVQLARSSGGTLYAVSREGALDRLVDGRAVGVVTLPAGFRVVAVAAADKIAFVVASDATPPMYSIVVAGP